VRDLNLLDRPIGSAYWIGIELVMPGLVPGIHVDGRDKPGHDDTG
jgi:hypothetical protein